MNKRVSKGWFPISRAAPEGGDFDRTEALTERLRRGPDDQSRWRLYSIQANVSFLKDYSISGVWRFMQRHGFSLHSARVQHYSPDPDYLDKETYLHQCLKEAAANPDGCILLFLDEMGYYRWPEPAHDWAQKAPVTDRKQSKQQQWRLIGALNALTGQVNYLDAYIVGRAKVIRFYQWIAACYEQAEQIYVVQDNWSIHKHPEVMAALENLPTIEPVWLPTYAPWLNPIEKLWRWLREDLLKLHHLADSFERLQQRVRAFLDQFRHGSTELLGYVGLLGEGKLAQAISQI